MNSSSGYNTQTIQCNIIKLLDQQQLTKMAKNTPYKAGVASVIAFVMVVVTLNNNFDKGLTSQKLYSAIENNRTAHLYGGDSLNFLQRQNQISSGRKLLQEGECRDVNNAEEKCEFIKNTSLCTNDEGFFDYYDFIYCQLETAIPAAMVILVLWWLFLFVGLAVCADDFFCPSLVVISKTLHLSPNVAGVTFLAFGNGAPDFFSALSALSSSDDSAELGIGGLFGAGIFVTCMVVGAIAVVKPFRAMARPFLRDIIFYLVAVYWAFVMIWRERVYLWEAICFVVLYVVYVVVVIISSSIYKRQKRKKYRLRL